MSDDEKMTEDENTNNDKTCANLGPLLNMRWLSNVLISSKTCSGKSHMLLSLLYHAAKKGLLNKTKTQIVVFSGSADTCDDFKSILPKAYIRRGFCEQTCLKVLALHKKKVELRKKQAERSGVPVLQDHLIVILDDCIGIGNSNVRESKALSLLATSGRHMYTSTYVSSQSAVHCLSPLWRLNASCILWCNLSQNHLKYIWQCTTGKSWKDFLEFTNSLGQWEFAYYDNSHKNSGFHKVKAEQFPKGKFFLMDKSMEKKKGKVKKKKDTQ